MTSENRNLLAFLVAMTLSAPVCVPAQSLDLNEGARDSSSDGVQALTREEWRLHILETKRRVQEEAKRIRSLPRQQTYPTTEELEKIATERVLQDSSLHFGDIVVTNRGKFVFRGRSEGDPKPEDFIRLVEP